MNPTCHPPIEANWPGAVTKEALPAATVKEASRGELKEPDFEVLTEAAMVTSSPAAASLLGLQ